MYSFGKLIIVHELSVLFNTANNNNDDDNKTSAGKGGFVYRGHTANVTVAKFNPAGTYIASGDTRGKLRIWSYDHIEHLPKLDIQALAGPIRDISWDVEGKRLVICGDGLQSSESSKVISWDTGVKCGDLTPHSRKKDSSCAFRPCRPMKIVTGGTDDACVYFHEGPPFKRTVGDTINETCHERGAVHSLRYNIDGSLLASVGTDGNVCFYDGKTMTLINKLMKVHKTSIYSCCWDRSGIFLLTCGADGYVRLLDGRDQGGGSSSIVHEWDVTEVVAGGGTSLQQQLGCTFVKGNIPVTVGGDGQIVVLPLPSSLDMIAKQLSSNNYNNIITQPLIITGHQAPISAMTFGSSSSSRVLSECRIYTADTDGVIVVWDGLTGQAIGRVTTTNNDGQDTMNNNNIDPTKVHAGATITSLVYINDTPYSTGWDDHVRTTNYGQLLCDNDAMKLNAQPNAMTAGTNLIVVMTVNGLVLLKEKIIITELFHLPYTATSVCLSVDDTTLFVGGNDCNIYVYSISIDNVTSPFTEIHVIKGGHLHPVYSLALSPPNVNDGDVLLAAGDLRDVCIYSTNTPDYRAIVAKGRWCFHSQRIGCLAWSLDGTILASGGNDDNIFLWCLSNKMKRVQYRFAHRGGITGLQFADSSSSKKNSSPGGAAINSGNRILVSAGADGCLNWWDVEKDVQDKFGC
jgi:WD40 repeat protein